MKNYYCLIAGLPDLSMDDSKLNNSVASFKKDIYTQLSEKDQKIIDIFYLQYDNKCLLDLLEDKDQDSINTCGNYTIEELSALISSVKEGDVWNKKYPSYLYTFILSYLKNKESGEFNAVLSEDYLSTCYYQYAMQCGNKFVASWYEYNLNVNNLLAAMTARKYKIDYSSYILGSTETCQSIRTSTARDFGLSGMLDYYDAVYRIFETDDLVDKERKIDLLKWNWMGDASFFYYFTIERIFVFLVRLSILERWISSDKEKGRKIFRQIIEDLKSNVLIPNELKNE